MLVAGQPLLLQLAAIGTVILGAYFAAAHLLGLAEMAQLRQSVTARRRR
jgi:hypothetical protein